MRHHYLPLCKGGDKMTHFEIENTQLRFRFDTASGLFCTGIYQKETEEEWLIKPCVPFTLEVCGKVYPADVFEIRKAEFLQDEKDRALIFELFLAEWKLRARLSVSVKEECLVFLLQAGADWQECPREVFLQIPLFRYFPEAGKWHLSANPRPKPDGSPALELHEEFPLPICCIDAETSHGVMMEFPDYPEFTGTWNQNRNRQLLQMTDREAFLNHNLLLRLQNKELADVAEIHFSSLTEGYKEAFFRYKAHIRRNMDFSMYDKEDYMWYRKALYHHLAFAYSREIFNYETQKFEVERLLDDGEAFGGYDILVLWFVYPRLGVDARKQWDFCDDIPGGMEGINEICDKAHARGVRVMLPYNPWDAEDDEALTDTLEHIAELVEKTRIDGVWFDTMDSIPKGFRERIERIRPGVICCLEVTPKVRETVEEITGSWNQRFRMPEGHVLRYLFPEHAAPMTSRWRVAEKKDMLIRRAIFNGTGFAVWQDVFGAWLPFDREQKAALKKWKGILLSHFDTYFGKESMPLYPVLQDELYINAFYHDGGEEEIYSVCNASDHVVEGALFRLYSQKDSEEDLQIEELWTGESGFSIQQKKIVSGTIEPERIYILKITRRKKV